MFERYHFTADTFGSEPPQNWEAVADYLNEIIDQTLALHPEAFDPGYDEPTITREGRILIDDIWESYWNGEYPEAPAAVYPE